MITNKLTKKERLYLYQFLIDMIDTSLPIFDSLKKLSSEGGGLLGKRFINKINKVIVNMQQNSSLTDSISEILPNSDVGIFSAADKSGNLKAGLVALIELNKFRENCLSKVRSALTVPLILILLTFIVIAGYSVNVFPTFIPVIPINQWPSSTAALYGLGNWIYTGGWAILLFSLMAILVMFYFLMLNFTGPLREYLGKIFPFSTYRKFVMTDTLVSLYLLLDSGIPYSDALRIMAKSANRYSKWHLQKIIHNLTLGMGYGDAMKTGLLDKKTIFDFSIYAELPSFISTLKQISSKSQTVLLSDFTITSAVLKNFATAFLGGVIIWVFVALFALIDVVSTNVS